MEGIVILLVLFVLWLLIAPIIALIRAGNATREAEHLRRQLESLTERCAGIEREQRRMESEREGGRSPIPRPEERETETARVMKWLDERGNQPVEPAAPSTPPPLPPAIVDTETAPEPEVPGRVEENGTQAPFSLEHFMGVKLFAWLGGVALFFGVIFFVKYAFENNLVPPVVRVTLGFITGGSLFVGGLATHRLPKYRVLAQAFCATGVLVLYGVTFAAHAVYHFAAFGPVSTFILMSVITLAAFLAAVRLEALVVAVLGMLGGFLTPELLATGHDNVFGLFGYIALLDIGLLAVSRHADWRFLSPAAAIGTALTQINWHARFFQSGSYDVGAKTLIPAAILLGFIMLFLTAGWPSRKAREVDRSSAGSLICLIAVAMLFAFDMLGFRHVAERPLLLYGLVLALNLAMGTLVMLRPQAWAALGLLAVSTFIHLGLWTTTRLTQENLATALGIYLITGALHAIPPVAFSKLRPASAVSFPIRISRWSGALVFLLLSVAVGELPMADPDLVFGAAFLMAALLAALALWGTQGGLVLAALAGALAVEGTWHQQHFQSDAPGVALAWYLGLYALFLIFPFVFRGLCKGFAGPWIASALSGVGHFLLVHDLVKRAFPNEMMGLLPAAFAVPSLLGLLLVIRTGDADEEHQRSRIAWFGGVTLLFISLVFPIQWDRQWLTLGWALEGALLLWLFRRVPHAGLQIVGLVLLAIAFVRLTFNPAVFADYPRSGTAILNWHLYVYGVVAAAQFAGAWWFTDPEDRLTDLKPCGVLCAFGGILLFLLLNIEIADFFTAPGDRCVAFRFGGNFARDMTYSIAWGLFSLGLLGMGIWRQSKPARFAAIGLLAATLLKVFLHDLAAIQNIFRIGALVGVAVIAFIASFLYQRFFDRTGPS